jgi:hypothetical protein
LIPKPKLVYKHKITGQRITLYKSASGRYVQEFEGGKIEYSYYELKDYRFMKKESITKKFGVVHYGKSIEPTPT